MKEYLYYTYKCQPSSETRGKRTSKPLSTPCGRTTKFKTSRAVSESSKHQGLCQCGNRPRLNPGNTTLHIDDYASHVFMNQRNHQLSRSDE